MLRYLRLCGLAPQSGVSGNPLNPCGSFGDPIPSQLVHQPFNWAAVQVKGDYDAGVSEKNS
jgi:hypothetical protein